MHNQILKPYYFLLFIVSILCLMLCNPAKASYASSIQKYSTLHVLTDYNRVQPGGTVWVMFHLELQPGWYTYWQNPGDSGLPPRLDAKLDHGLSITDLHFQPPTTIHVGDLVDYGYYDNAYFLARIQVPNHIKVDNTTLDLQLDWVACKDLCIPQSARVNLPLQIGDAEVANERSLVNEQLVQYKNLEDTMGRAAIHNQLVRISIPIATATSIDAPFVYIGQANTIDKMHQQSWQHKNDELAFELKQGTTSIEALSGFVKLNQDEFVRFSIPNSQIKYTANAPAAISLWIAIAFAFLGGIILNIMPCVFPILTLKILSIAKIKDSTFSARFNHGLIYTFGILLGFILLATVLTLLTQAGHSIGWGFQMQSPLFLGIMVYVLFLVAMNLFGWVEFIIPIPVSLNDHGAYTYRSSFYAGLLITLIATPCTAPFMAPAIGYALTQPPLVIYAVFMSLGAGLAFPYILASTIPFIANIMPKPGPWLLTFKQILAFPMLLSVIWLLWVLMKSANPNYVAGILIGMTALAIYIWYQYRFQSSRLTKRIIMILMFGLASLPLASEMIQSDDTIIEVHQIEALNQDHNLLVNVTADWCLTCKVNESVVFANPSLKQFLSEHNIGLYTLDWTKPDESITQYLQSFGRSGVPMYVFYPKNGTPEVLPQVITPQIVKEHILEKLNKND